MKAKDYLDDLLTEGPTYAVWEAFDCWLRCRRRDHPEDERTGLELLNLYAYHCQIRED